MDDIIRKLEFKINTIKKGLVLAGNKEVQLHELNELDKIIHMLYAEVFFDGSMNKRNTVVGETLIEKISNENILEKLEKLETHIKDADTIAELGKIVLDIKLTNVEYEVCESCHNTNINQENQSMCICNYCGYIKYVTGNNKSIPRSKIGNFNPHRHFKNWMERIIGREPEEEIEVKVGGKKIDVIKILREDLINKNKSIEHITVDDIRASLKEIKQTHLNKNTTLIAKKLTGRNPPVISDKCYQRTYDLFIRVMAARDMLNNSRCNRIYYPYYIYKIFSIVLEGEGRKIINYIHLNCGGGKVSCHCHLGSDNGKTVRVLAASR